MEIAKLVVKKLTATLSPTERKAFNTWLHSSPENEEVFHRIALIHKSGKDITELQSLDEIKAWDKLYQKVHPHKMHRKERRFSYTTPLAYAAVLTGLLFLASWYFFHTSRNNKETIPLPDKNAITLQLENGEIKVLSEDGSAMIKDKKGNAIVSQKGSTLAYSDSTVVHQLAYNTLTVPYAKRFEISLSDGTNVHLNSGSSIRYPVRFVDNEPREVFLTGEAFFEVTEDTERPFVVTSDHLMVTVMGTVFNVKAYPEDERINTVLVSGSVGLSHKNQATADIALLLPGQKASWSKNNGSITTKAVDTELYTSWIHGRLVLKRTSFAQIIPKLQRHYNVSIVNNYDALNDQVFTASYDIETIEEVLESLSEIIPFRFETNANEIIIHEPSI